MSKRKGSKCTTAGRSTSSFSIELPEGFDEWFATKVRLNLDLPGIFFVEACERIESGQRRLLELRSLLNEHQTRVIAARTPEEANEDSWTDVLQGVGGFEPLFALTIRDFSLADILLVACAEAYANAVSAHVLNGREAEFFGTLNPTAKWLFLPRVMRLKKKHDWALDREPLQSFAAVVARRNRLVHPKEVNVQGPVDAHSILDRMDIDPSKAVKGRDSVRDLIRGLCDAWKGSSGPLWLDPTNKRWNTHAFYLGNIEGGALLARPGDRDDDVER